MSTSKILTRAGPLAPGFEPTFDFKSFLANDMRVLVIGAGGLGCELLKNLALLGFGKIDVIDMDTIDLSNLNRQFLFRPKDVGRFKAEVAAEFINSRIAGCTVTPHNCRIEEKDADFYRQFMVVISGLDSVAARRWINSMLLSLVEYEDGQPLEHTVIRFIDGGTEGFKGNVRVIHPGRSACVECTMDLFPPQKTFPLCTIANTPRLPEHCIEYAKVVQWPKEKRLDGDDPDHIKWIFDRATERAAQFGISGVTYRLTQGVVKNIIPAVASTNAIVAAACANEAWKLATACCPSLDNYMFFSDTEGVYAYSFAYERKEDCPACSRSTIDVTVDSTCTVEQLRAVLVSPESLRLASPSLTAATASGNVVLFMDRPEALRKASEENLPRALTEFGLGHGAVLNVSDPTSVRPFTIRLCFRP